MNIRMLTVTLWLLTVSGAAGAAPLMEKYTAAWKLYGMRRHDEAIVALKAIIQTDPSFFRAHELLVKSHKQAGSMEQAEVYFKDLMKVRPDSAASYALGMYYAFRSDYPSAERYLRRCVQTTPGIVRCHQHLIEAMVMNRRGKLKIAELKGVFRDDDPNQCYGYFHFYKNVGKHGEAKRTAARCLAIAEAEDNIQLQAEILGYLKGYYLLTGDGYEEALSHRERFEELARRLGDPDEILGVKCGDAGALSMMGRDMEAENLLSDCLRTVEEAGHEEWRVQILARMGELAVQRGNYETAVEKYRLAQTTLQKNGNRYDAAWAGKRIGQAHQGMGLLSQAKRDFESSLAEFRTRNERAWRSEQAWCLQYLSNVQAELGEYFAAIRSGTEAVRLHRELGMEWQAGMATGELATLYESLGDYGTAVRHAQSALDSATALGDQAEQQRNLTRLGDLLIKIKRPGDALVPLNRSLVLSAKTKLSSDRVSTLLSMGYAFSRLGRHRESISKLQEALDLAQRLGSSQQEAEAQYRLGELFTASSTPVAAQPHLSSARALAEKRGNADLLSRTLWQQAILQRRAGRLLEALKLIETAVTSIEGHRKAVPSPELRTSYLERNSAVYEEAIFLLSLLHDRHPQGGYDNQTLQYAERSRARSLLDLLEEPQFRLIERLIPGDRRDRTRLELDWSRAVTESQRHPSVQTRSALEAEERRLADWWTKIRLRYPLRTGTSFEPLAVASTIRDVQQERDVSILEYTLGEERSHLWVVSSGGVQMTRLPGRRQIAESIHAYREEITRLPAGDKADAYRAHAASLYNMLIRPAGTALVSKRLVIIPDGELYYLPFEALLNGSDSIKQYPFCKFIPPAASCCLPCADTSSPFPIPR